jgi:hypothetical protein
LAGVGSRSPDEAPVKQKMTYTSAKNIFKETLDGSLLFERSPPLPIFYLKAQPDGASEEVFVV